MTREPRLHDAVSEVLENHPQLAELLLGADYWPQDDGTVRVVWRAPDADGVAAAHALAQALDMRWEEIAPHEPAPARPDGPALTFEEAAARFRGSADGR